MASFNTNNHIMSSLEFVHRGTIVFLRCFGPFSNKKPFERLHNRVFPSEQAFVSNKDHTQTSEFQRRHDMVVGVKGGHIEK